MNEFTAADIEAIRGTIQTVDTTATVEAVNSHVLKIEVVGGNYTVRQLSGGAGIFIATRSGRDIQLPQDGKRSRELRIAKSILRDRERRLAKREERNAAHAQHVAYQVRRLAALRAVDLATDEDDRVAMTAGDVRIGGDIDENVSDGSMTYSLRLDGLSSEQVTAILSTLGAVRS